MNNEQLEKGKDLQKCITKVKVILNKCQKSLIEIQREPIGNITLYGDSRNEYCELKIGSVSGVEEDYLKSVSILINNEQMSYALILAEKKIQRDLNKLTTEFKNL